MANYKNIVIGIIGGVATATIAKIVENDYTQKINRQKATSFMVNTAMIDILRQHDERLDQVTPSRKYRNPNPKSKMKQDYKPNNHKEDNHE